jgi:hypothetical protein
MGISGQRPGMKASLHLVYDPQVGVGPLSGKPFVKLFWTLDEIRSLNDKPNIIYVPYAGRHSLPPECR